VTERTSEEDVVVDPSMTAGQVRQLVESGTARPLLSGFEVSPTWYDGRWWYVPSDAPDGADYVPADAERSASFDRLRERADRIDSFLAEDE
jgi:hypothetical protein